jgi:AbrB family looped-hinge helix DNA binding protein
MTSKVTGKYQVTIPKRVRDRMHLTINSAIEWSIHAGKVTVKKADAPFLRRQGSIKIGKGSIEADIEKAKKKYGTK